MRRRDLLRLGEVLQAGHDLIACVEDDSKGLRAVLLVQQLCFHRILLCCPCHAAPAHSCANATVRRSYVRLLS
jgi:hypothetical protein